MQRNAMQGVNLARSGCVNLILTGDLIFKLKMLILTRFGDPMKRLVGRDVLLP